MLLQKNIVLSVENITKHFGKICAVDSLSFEVYEGEIFGILGPNGAGKSTTLMIITGLVRPNTGRVTIFGNYLNHNFIKVIEKLGISLESPGFYDYLTGYENLRLFGRLKRISKDEINYALFLVELADQKNQKVKTYSLGMRKRLCLANALLGSPKILVLDEPTTGLDPNGAKKMLDLICDLSEKKKISTIISSNLLHDIEAICHRVLLIDKGKKIICESVSKLIIPIENSYIIRITPTDDAFFFLQKIDSVKKIVLLKSNSIKVSLQNLTSGELNRILVEKGFDISEIIPLKRTLRELFLELNS